MSSQTKTRMPKEQRFNMSKAELIELLPKVKSLFHKADDSAVCHELRTITLHATVLINGLDIEGKSLAFIMKDKALFFFETVDEGLSTYENEQEKDPVLLVNLIARVYTSIESFTMSL
ncbi:hypothetical protein [Xanthocytophaga agilis]|uniref:Uncharacterized protein n=1 Tax=Xanthocytophaga agilis TaxID=3048010 RepID=A0AAE3UDP4_9BACT|nr:hypothetical protein [Xanthocytophaga agilis]MDJ1499412.1 hypothetical protein [Xanthocytophaga agilis]